MSTQKLSNISLATLRVFLSACGCEHVSTEGGHEKWRKVGLTRPIIIQTHIDPVPEFIVNNILRNLQMSKADFFATLNK